MNQRKAGVILSYISMGLNAVIGFIYIPLLLAFLSKEQYGLYQLVGSMIAYLTIMDFGLANTTIRYYSRLLATKDIQGQENLLATVLRLYGIIAGCLFVVGLAALFCLLPFYTNTLSPAELHTAKQIYIIMLFNLTFVIPGNIFSAIIQAHERFVFLKSMNLLNIILQPLLVFLVLHIKASVLCVVIVQTLCNFSLLSTNAWYAIKHLQVRFKLHRKDIKFIKEILFFSFFVFLNAIMDQVYWRTGQLILGAVAGTVAVAVYAVSVQLSTAFMSFSSTVSSVFLPKLSALATTEESLPQINAIFTKVGRLQFYVVMLIFFGFFLFGKQFLVIWVGKDFLPAYTYALILMFGLIIPLVQNTGILILQAKNKHAFRSIIFVIIAAMNVMISIPLAKKYGALSCAWVTTSCLLLGQGIILNMYYYKIIKLDIPAFFKQLLRIFIIMCLPVCLFLAVKSHLPFGNTIWTLGGEIIFFTVVYFGCLWALAFNTYEKNLILTPLNKYLIRK